MILFEKKIMPTYVIKDTSPDEMIPEPYGWVWEWVSAHYVGSANGREHFRVSCMCKAPCEPEGLLVGVCVLT